MGDHAQRHIHVRQREVNFFRSLRRHREVRQNDIHLSGLQVLNSARRFGRNVFEFHAQILSDPVAEIHVIPLVFAVLIHIAERALVREHADADLAARLDLLQCSVARILAFGSIRGISRFCFRFLRLRLIRALRRRARSGAASGQQRSSED